MVTSTDAVAAAATTVNAASTAKASTSAATAASDFNSFLQLLTAQLKNQDPLSPLDSTQFVEQLASFSAVEQQIETNRLLEELASGMTKSGLEAATAWIGKEVEAEVEGVYYSGEALDFVLPEDVDGGALEVVIRSDSGTVVRRETVGAGQHEFSWDGLDDSGAAAAEGVYALALEGMDEDVKVDSAPLIAVAAVREARLVDGALNLILDNGAMIEPSAISAVRDAAVDEPITG